MHWEKDGWFSLHKTKKDFTALSRLNLQKLQEKRMISEKHERCTEILGLPTNFENTSLRILADNLIEAESPTL